MKERSTSPSFALSGPASTEDESESSPKKEAPCPTKNFLLMGQSWDLPIVDDGTEWGWRGADQVASCSTNEDLIDDMWSLSELWAKASESKTATGDFFEDFANEAYGGTNTNLAGVDFPFADSLIGGVYYSVKGTSAYGKANKDGSTGQKHGFSESRSKASTLCKVILQEGQATAGGKTIGVGVITGQPRGEVQVPFKKKNGDVIESLDLVRLEVKRTPPKNITVIELGQIGPDHKKWKSKEGVKATFFKLSMPAGKSTAHSILWRQDGGDEYKTTLGAKEELIQAYKSTGQAVHPEISTASTWEAMGFTTAAVTLSSLDKVKASLGDFTDHKYLNLVKITGNQESVRRYLEKYYLSADGGAMLVTRTGHKRKAGTKDEHGIDPNQPSKSDAERDTRDSESKLEKRKKLRRIKRRVNTRLTNFIDPYLETGKADAADGQALIDYVNDIVSKYLEEILMRDKPYITESNIRRDIRALMMLEELTKADKKEIDKLIKKGIEKDRGEQKKLIQKELEAELKKSLGQSFFRQPGKIRKTIEDVCRQELAKEMKKGSDLEKSVVAVTKKVLSAWHELLYKQQHIIQRVKI